MRVIWKTALHACEGTQQVTLPLAAIPLSAIDQDGVLVVYWIVETDNVYESCRVEIVGTGSPLERHMSHRTYVGTVHIDPYVWHVFV